MLRQGKILLTGLLIVSILFLFWTVAYRFSSGEMTLTRNPFGEGDKEFCISLKKENEKKNVSLLVREKVPSQKELDRIYDEFFKKLEKEMCGKNLSLKKVTENLSFPEQLSGYPFRISYQTGDSAWIQLDGSLGKDARLLKKGEKKEVNIKVTASYQKYRKSHIYTIDIIDGNCKKVKDVFSGAQAYLKKKEKESRGKEILSIPSAFEDVKMEESGKERKSVKIFMLSFILLLLIPVHNYLDLKEKGKKYQEEAEKDFPVIVHLLTLYMGAGLSFFSAVSRISSSYRERRERTGARYAFDKLLFMEQQMKTGVGQKEACLKWGAAFEKDCYRKLSVILTQSFTKGAREAASLMEEAEKEAFAARIDRARKEGEEASTKLLFPMILLLFLVMLLVMYPALIRFRNF